jgi:hypothetical protein
MKDYYVIDGDTLIRAIASFEGYRREMDDYQPCDVEKELRAILAKPAEPVAWKYSFGDYSEALMPDEVEQDAFKVHPELYVPLFAAPEESC